MEARRGADIVLHLFDHVDRQSTSLREPFLDTIISAFLAATSMDEDYDIELPPNNNRSSHLALVLHEVQEQCIETG